MDRAGVISADVHELLLGQVLAAGEGRNPVRRAAKDVRMPDEANGEPDATIVTHSLAETEQALSGHAWRDDREYSAYAECVSAIKHHLRNCAKSLYMQAQRCRSESLFETGEGIGEVALREHDVDDDGKLGLKPGGKSSWPSPPIDRRRRPAAGQL